MTNNQEASHIVVFPRGQLTPKDKERMTKIGVIAIEADDPSLVRVLSAEPLPVGSNAMLVVALESMCGSSGGSSVQAAFTRNLLASIKENS